MSNEKHQVDLENEFKELYEYVMKTPIESLNDVFKIDSNFPIGKDLTTNFEVGRYKYKYEGFISIMENKIRI